MIQYGVITSRPGTRREIGGMSAAGDQGEALKAWREVEKRDKASVATMGGASRGARRARERDFHNSLSLVRAHIILCWRCAGQFYCCLLDPGLRPSIRYACYAL